MPLRRRVLRILFFQAPLTCTLEAIVPQRRLPVPVRAPLLINVADAQLLSRRDGGEGEEAGAPRALPLGHH